MEDLLFLAHRVPYPPDKGEKIRAFHVLKHLARNYRIHLGCFADDPADEDYAPQLAEFCTRVFVAPLNRKKALLRGLSGLAFGSSLSESYFRDSRMQRFVSETMAHARLENIFIYCSVMAPYTKAYARTHRVILDMVDVDSEKFRAYADKAPWPLSTLYARESRALFALERHAAIESERCFFVSKAEADTFLALAPEAKHRVSYFHNGVDLEYFDPAREYDSPFTSASAPIVFTGTMDYRPNVDAVVWFADEIFPAVRDNYPAAEFWIVGANPAPGVRMLAQRDGIHVTGRVPDVRPYVAHAACMVAPLHIARGVQNKVLEAMAMARPIVATPAACEGISVEPGSELLVADTQPAFARAICSVLAGENRGLGERARARVEADYRWSSNLGMLDRLFGTGDGPRVQADAELRATQGAMMGIAS